MSIDRSQLQETNEPINPATTTARYIPWELQEPVQNVGVFKGNAVSSAKYDPYFITFLPRFLFEMFSRVAYLYFLIQVRMLLSQAGPESRRSCRQQSSRAHPSYYRARNTCQRHCHGCDLPVWRRAARPACPRQYDRVRVQEPS